MKSDFYVNQWMNPVYCGLRPSDPISDEDDLQALKEGVVFAFRYLQKNRDSVQDRLSASTNVEKQHRQICQAYCHYRHILTVNMAKLFQNLTSQGVST
jgi:hypothetical protein